MHPTHENLRGYLDGTLTDSERRLAIEQHLGRCEFCAEWCDQFRELTQPLDPLTDSLPADLIGRIANNAYSQAMAGAIVPLQPLIVESKESMPTLMAADGNSEIRPQVENIATLFSDNPEMVLKVMRDTISKREYVDLISEDPALAAHVLVELPDLNREFLTDANGRAELDLEHRDDLNKLKWQIRMPEAVFDLEPLQYDPEKVEYAAETVLESDRHDRIEFRFEGRAESKQLIIKVLELDGNADFAGLKIAVSQGEFSQFIPVMPGQSVEIGPFPDSDTINIRLY